MRLAAVVGAIVWIGAACPALAQPDESDDGSSKGGALPAGESVVVNPMLPVGGVVIIEVSDGTQPVVQVSQLDGTVVNTYGGSLRMLTSQHWAWEAVPPLAAGGYEITIATTHGTQRVFEVTVIAEVSLEPPEIALEPSAQWVPSASLAYYCEQWSGSELVIQSSFAAATEGEVLIAPGVSTEAERAQVDQYLYRLTTPGNEQVQYLPFERLGDVGPFAMQAEEYCFGLELLAASTGEVIEIEALTPTCVPHGDLPSLILEEAEVPDRALSRFVCDKPPEGFEVRWCTLNDACETVERARLADEHCVLYGHVCRDEGLPAPGTAPAGTAGASGAAGTNSDHDGGLQPHDDEAAGCTVSGERSSQRSAVPLALLFLAWLLIGRRSSARASCGR